jgi:hypothetical protein
MQLEVKYQCDICSNSFLLDFNKAITEKKMKCSNCGVEYRFTEEELDEFDKCYNKLLKRLKNSNAQTKSID